MIKSSCVFCSHSTNINAKDYIMCSWNVMSSIVFFEVTLTLSLNHTLLSNLPNCGCGFLRSCFHDEFHPLWFLDRSCSNECVMTSRSWLSLGWTWRSCVSFSKTSISSDQRSNRLTNCVPRVWIGVSFICIFWLTPILLKMIDLIPEK